MTVKSMSVVGGSEEESEDENGMLKNDGSGKEGVMEGGLNVGDCCTVKEKK